MNSLNRKIESDSTHTWRQSNSGRKRAWHQLDAGKPPSFGEGADPTDLPTEPGLIMVKIDGLSYRQLQRGLPRGRLPHLGRFLENEGYQLQPFYSGMPSSTPAVQGELFFGVRTSVPGVSFYQRETNKKFIMLFPGSAQKMAATLERRGEPLLRCGASYSNIYTGGAEEARYCIQSMTLRSARNLMSSIQLFVSFVVRPVALFRILGYGFAEAGIALLDFFRGMMEGKSVGKELKFIPTRVIVCILLRELIRARVKMDIKRGRPIIHASFLGYDEQAHRRGPASAFAHWTLKGIDAAAADIYRNARRSTRRDYRVVFYSEHGQEPVIPFSTYCGKSLEHAVMEAAKSAGITDASGSAKGRAGRESHEAAGRHSGRLFQGISLSERRGDRSEGADGIRIAAMGPLGHIYLPRPVAPETLAQFSRSLVLEQWIPLVFFLHEGAVFAVNQRGRFNLMTETGEVLGEDHPLADPVARDLVRTCRHPHAGDLVISGWRPGRMPLTFATENGAHGGPGKEETRGFALLPKGFDAFGKPLRPMDLRDAVFSYFGNTAPQRPVGKTP